MIYALSFKNTYTLSNFRLDQKSWKKLLYLEFAGTRFDIPPRLIMHHFQAKVTLGLIHTHSLSLLPSSLLAAFFFNSIIDYEDIGFNYLVIDI